MPSTYAHKKFGAKVLKKLPKDVRELILDNLDEYLVGLHGPDVLFFYRPGTSSEVTKIGNKYHRTPFSVMFQRGKGQLNQHYSDESLVYFLGLLTHFYLDSAAHPLIGKAVDELGLSHGKVETEFDRYLLTKDGKKPVGYKAVAHLPVYPSVAQAASIFYDGVSTPDFLESLATMKAINLVCESDADRVRKTVCKIMDATGNTEKVASLVMSRQKSEKAAQTMKKLDLVLENEVDVCAEEIISFARDFKNCEIQERFKMDYLGKM